MQRGAVGKPTAKGAPPLEGLTPRAFASEGLCVRGPGESACPTLQPPNQGVAAAHQSRSGAADCTSRTKAGREWRSSASSLRSGMMGAMPWACTSHDSRRAKVEKVEPGDRTEEAIVHVGCSRCNTKNLFFFFARATAVTVWKTNNCSSSFSCEPTEHTAYQPVSEVHGLGSNRSALPRVHTAPGPADLPT